MDRLSKIDEYIKCSNNKDNQIKSEIAELGNQIKNFGPKITDIFNVIDKCKKSGNKTLIEFGKSWTTPTYEDNKLEACENCYQTLILRYNNGIIWVREDGTYSFSSQDSKVNLSLAKKFLAYYDDFEKEFYKSIDSIIL